MTDDGTRHTRHAPGVTDPAPNHAAMTGMTDVLPFPEMTHDRLSQVRPHVRAEEGKPGKPADPSSVMRRRPPWLYDGPLTDRARLISCNRCHRPVLEALADGVMPTRIDLAYLTPLQELEHLLAGGMTLRLWPDPATSDTRRVAFRRSWDIQAHPGHGLPIHDCAVVRRPDPSLLTHRAHSAWPEEPTF